MSRPKALAAALLIVLPYAKAPLCHAGGHEHPHPHAAAGEAIGPQPDHAGSMECHALMGCNVIVQASVGHEASGERAPRRLAVRRGAVAYASETRASPEAPPPKPI